MPPSPAFKRRLAIGFVAVVLCAAIIAIAAYFALDSTQAATDDLADLYSRDLIDTMKVEYLAERVVAAGRTYLTTGEERYLSAANTARAEAEQLLLAMRRREVDQGDLAELDMIIEAQRAHGAAVREVLGLPESGAPLQDSVADWEDQVTPGREELHTLLGAFSARKAAQRDQARRWVADATARSRRLILLTAALGLLLASLLAYILTRTLASMYHAEAAARDAAEEARQWFATTLSSIGDAVIATDVQGRVTFLNSVAESLTGWTSSEAMGKGFEVVFPIVNEDTHEPSPQPIQKALATGKLVHLANHTALVRKDGAELPIEDSAAPIRDAHGKLAGVVLVFRDVTKRRQADRALRESTERLVTTLRSIGDAVIATDAQGRITTMNEVAERLSGWREAEVKGMPLDSIFRIVNESSRKPVDSPVEKVLRTGALVGLANHTVLISRDGTEWPIDNSAAPIVSSEGEVWGVVLVFREITQRKAAEQALVRTEKLATAGRLAATIAHEINNPLDAVMGLIYICRSHESLPQELKQHLDVADAELQRIAQISKQTLGFHKESAAPRLVVVTAVLEDVLRLYERRLNAHSVRVLKDFRDEGIVLALPGELRQIFSNFISNAIDALPEGGRIGLRTSLMAGDGESKVRVTIADSGRGIEAAHLPKVQEPFFTTKAEVGTGLGLWVAKELVQKHNGRLRIRSRPGRGTVVSVCFPAAHKLASGVGRSA